MKKILSKKLTLVLAVLIAAMGLNTAATNSDVKVKLLPAAKQQLTTQPTATWQGNPNLVINMHDATTPPLAPAAKAGENTIKVTFERDCDEDIFEAEMMSYMLCDQYGNNFPFFTSNFDFGVNSIQIPPGTYDVIAFCWRRSYPLGHPLFDNAGGNYVVREQVEFTADTTVCINPGEANILIQFDPRFPDGAECIPPVMQQTEDDLVVAIPGSISDKMNMYQSGLGLRDKGWLTGTAGSVGRTFIQEGADMYMLDLSKKYNFYVNQVSDRFVFLCNFAFAKLNFDGSFYNVNFEVSTCDNTVVTNRPEDYVMYEKEFKQSPNGLETNYGLHPAFEFSVYDDRIGLIGKGGFQAPSYTLADDEKCQYYICSSQEDEGQWQVFTQPGVVNAEDPRMTGVLHTYDPYVALEDGNLVSVNQGIACYNDYAYELVPDPNNKYGFSYYSPFDWNPAFTYGIDKTKIMSGNSCPILVPKVLSWDYGNNEVEKALECQKYIGRNGEWRECDAASIYAKIWQNDELIGEGEGFYRVGWNNEDYEGDVELLLTNSNVDVDGLQGTNQTTIHFSLDSEDDAAPTLHMLDFRDGEDNVIDRFATAADGKFQFYGGDFNEFNNDDQYRNQYYVCSPMASVEVSYSPYQEDNWNELEATEVPELYFNRMGYLYRGTLEGVTGEAFEGWFDMKIRLEDAAGNWQEQVISPAFRIDNLAYSGIATPHSSNANEVARYNLAGQRVDSNATGVVIVKMSDGTARKVIQ